MVGNFNGRGAIYRARKAKGNNHHIRSFFLLLPFCLFLSGCIQEEPGRPEIVAKVGDRVLTSGEVAAWEVSLPQHEVPQEVRSSFIRRWVEEELLYQEALERGLDKDPWVQQRLDELSRTLLIARLIEVECRELPKPSPSAVKNYFQNRSADFVWPQLHLVVEYWCSEDRSGMFRLRSNLLRGQQTGLWQGRVSNLETGRIALDGPDSADPQVWRTVVSLKSGQVSQVSRINDAYWVFKLVDRREAGELQGFDDVRDVIVARLTEETRRHYREDVIRSLIDKYRRTGRLQWSVQTVTINVTDSTKDITE